MQYPSGIHSDQRSLLQKKERIIHQLREKGCRITKQRLMLLDIILEGDCSCCKEIYYKAVKKDSEIGTATVYRMVNTLEEMGVISRKNMYRVSDSREDEESSVCTVELNDDTVFRLSRDKWNQVLEEGLRSCGYLSDQTVKNIQIAESERK